MATSTGTGTGGPPAPRPLPSATSGPAGGGGGGGGGGVTGVDLDHYVGLIRRAFEVRLLGNWRESSLALRACSQQRSR